MHVLCRINVVFTTINVYLALRVYIHWMFISTRVQPKRYLNRFQFFYCAFRFMQILYILSNCLSWSVTFESVWFIFVIKVCSTGLASIENSFDQLSLWSDSGCTDNFEPSLVAHATSLELPCKNMFNLNVIGHVIYIQEHVCFNVLHRGF